MDIKKIYDTIFPIGSVDDNNRYTNLSGNQLNTVQLVEPTLSVQEFIYNKPISDSNYVPYKMAYRIPMISVNGLYIEQPNLCSFKLDYTEFVPSVVFEFMDPQNSILSTNIPKEGSIIKIYIGGNGDELYYKPIRQDFILTSIRQVGGNYKYRVYGKLNVPYGYRKESWCGGNSTAMQALFNLAVWTGLGFSTNFTNQNTLDKMNWRNDQTGTFFDFMENISKHACYSPNTFFTAFIDQYNVLNFIECHSLLSHGGDKSDVPAMIYNSFPPNDLPNFNPNEQEKNTRNQLPLDNDDDEYNNKFQKLSYYFLTNDDFFNGWTNYIESYQEISNSNSSLSDGFQTHVIYTDSNKGKWGGKVCDFTIRPIDNLKRDPSTQKIQSFELEPTQESYIPLNLIQMNKNDENQSGVDDLTTIESFNNFGNVDTSNTFKQYFFAEVQNEYQMRCLKKCGLKLKLQNYNPSITKFSRVWVDIYDDNPYSNGEISKKSEDSTHTGKYVEYIKQKNNNILFFEDEGVVDAVNPRLWDRWPAIVYNRSLSGWYVVTSIEIEYDPKDNNLKMNLTLNRIEYRPSFKDEYYISRNGIERYKQENNIEDIIKIK